MDTPAPSSFIPHDTAQMTVSAPRSRGLGGLSDIFFVLSFVLCAASLAVAVGVFLYGQYLATLSASKLDQLDRAKKALDPSLISQLTRLDDRMNAADQILSRHMAPALLFDALNQTTLTTVSFATFDLDAADPGHVALKMTGVAQSVNSVALQSEIFGKNGIITSPIFSGISRQQDGVHFSVTASVNPGAITWSRLVSGAAIVPASSASSSTTGPTQNPAATPQGPAPFEGPARPQDATPADTGGTQ